MRTLWNLERLRRSKISLISSSRVCFYNFYYLHSIRNLDKKRRRCSLAQRGGTIFPRSQKFNTERITLASFSLCYYMIDTSSKTMTKEIVFSPLSFPHSFSVYLHVHSLLHPFSHSCKSSGYSEYHRLCQQPFVQCTCKCNRPSYH